MIEFLDTLNWFPRETIFIAKDWYSCDSVVFKLGYNLSYALVVKRSAAILPATLTVFFALRFRARVRVQVPRPCVWPTCSWSMLEVVIHRCCANKKWRNKTLGIKPLTVWFYSLLCGLHTPFTIPWHMVLNWISFYWLIELKEYVYIYMCVYIYIYTQWYTYTCTCLYALVRLHPNFLLLDLGPMVIPHILSGFETK